MATAAVVKEITPPGAMMTETPELEKALESATSIEDIRAIVAGEAAKQNIVVPDKPAPAKEDAQAEPEAKDDEKFTYVDEFVIGGKTYKFEGDSAADVIRQAKAAMAAHADASRPEQKQEAAPAAAAKKTADEKVALELDYKLGKIGLDEYLEKSGALDTYLEKKGVKVDQLKEVVEEKVSRKEEDAWASATEAFRQEHGAEWPGGQQNLKIIGLKLAELGLQNKPSAESLNKAFEAMKADGLVFPVETKAEPKPEVQPKKKQLSGSSMFGLSGGAGRDRAANTSAAQVPQITNDMDPREIMEAYKTAALANGQNPDDLLRESHQRR